MWLKVLKRRVKREQGKDRVAKRSGDRAAQTSFCETAMLLLTWWPLWRLSWANYKQRVLVGELARTVWNKPKVHHLLPFSWRATRPGFGQSVSPNFLRWSGINTAGEKRKQTGRKQFPLHPLIHTTACVCVCIHVPLLVCLSRNLAIRCLGRTTRATT